MMPRDRESWIRTIVLTLAFLAFLAGSAAMAMSLQANSQASANANRIAANAQAVAQENEDRVDAVGKVADQAQAVADSNRVLVCTFLSIIEAENNGTESQVAGQMRANFRCGP